MPFCASNLTNARIDTGDGNPFRVNRFLCFAFAHGEIGLNPSADARFLGILRIEAVWFLTNVNSRFRRFPRGNRAEYLVFPFPTRAQIQEDFL